LTVFRWWPTVAHDSVVTMEAPIHRLRRHDVPNVLWQQLAKILAQYNLKSCVQFLLTLPQFCSCHGLKEALKAIVAMEAIPKEDVDARVATADKVQFSLVSHTFGPLEVTGNQRDNEESWSFYKQCTVYYTGTKSEQFWDFVQNLGYRIDDLKEAAKGRIPASKSSSRSRVEKESLPEFTAKQVERLFVAAASSSSLSSSSSAGDHQGDSNPSEGASSAPSSSGSGGAVADEEDAEEDPSSCVSPRDKAPSAKRRKIQQEDDDKEEAPGEPADSVLALSSTAKGDSAVAAECSSSSSSSASSSSEGGIINSPGTNTREALERLGERIKARLPRKQAELEQVRSQRDLAAGNLEKAIADLASYEVSAAYKSALSAAQSDYQTAAQATQMAEQELDEAQNEAEKAKAAEKTCREKFSQIQKDSNEFYATFALLPDDDADPDVQSSKRDKLLVDQSLAYARSRHEKAERQQQSAQRRVEAAREAFLAAAGDEQKKKEALDSVRAGLQERRSAVGQAEADLQQLQQQCSALEEEISKMHRGADRQRA
jgi:hypothetical protein